MLCIRKQACNLSVSRDLRQLSRRELILVLERAIVSDHIRPTTFAMHLYIPLGPTLQQRLYRSDVSAVRR